MKLIDFLQVYDPSKRRAQSLRLHLCKAEDPDYQEEIQINLRTVVQLYNYDLFEMDQDVDNCGEPYIDLYIMKHAPKEINSLVFAWE